MNSIHAIALSGLGAANARLSVSAHNVANAQTPDFKRQLVQAQTQAGGGVAVEFAHADAAGAELAVDLAGEVVDQLEAVHAFKANWRTLQAADTLLGTLLDIQA